MSEVELKYCRFINSSKVQFSFCRKTQNVPHWWKSENLKNSNRLISEKTTEQDTDSRTNIEMTKWVDFFLILVLFYLCIPLPTPEKILHCLRLLPPY